MIEAIYKRNANMDLIVGESFENSNIECLKSYDDILPNTSGILKSWIIACW